MALFNKLQHAQELIDEAYTSWLSGLEDDLAIVLYQHGGLWAKKATNVLHKYEINSGYDDCYEMSEWVLMPDDNEKTYISDYVGLMFEDKLDELDAKKLARFYVDFLHREGLVGVAFDRMLESSRDSYLEGLAVDYAENGDLLNVY